MPDWDRDFQIDRDRSYAIGLENAIAMSVPNNLTEIGQ